MRRISRMMRRRVRRNFEFAPGALELMGMAIALHHDGGALGQAQIALAQFDALALGQIDQLSIARWMSRQPLDGRSLSPALWCPPQPVRDLGLDRPTDALPRGLLQQRGDLLLTQPLAPATSVTSGQTAARAGTPLLHRNTGQYGSPYPPCLTAPRQRRCLHVF